MLTNVLITAAFFSSTLAGRLFGDSGSGYFLEMLYRSICVFDLKQESPEEHVADLFLYLKNVEPYF